MQDHPVETLKWAATYASRASRIRASEIRELLHILERPEIISFAGGIPDPALFPLDAFRGAFDAVLGSNREGGLALQYSVTEGYGPLRAWIAGYMQSRGVPCSVENILITAGSQQALDLIAKLFVGPGDTVLVTAPTYLGALQVFNAYEADYETLDLDDPDPMRYWRRVEEAKGRIAAAYVVADFANPTGNCLAKQERENLLGLAGALRIPVIEDAAYEAIRFQGEAIPSCQALDIARLGCIARSRVIYCGSFSKTMAPGLRLGWVCAASEVVRKLALVKQGADLHAAQIGQMVMHRVVERIFSEQCEKVRSAYRAKCEAMHLALERFMPHGVAWTRPRGGMFVWLTLPRPVNGVQLLSQALRSANVAFVPGGAFYARDPLENTIRLNYSRPGLEDIAAGVERLASLIRTELNSLKHV